MKEIYYFSREMTIVDEFRELFDRLVAFVKRHSCLSVRSTAPLEPERVNGPLPCYSDRPNDACDLAVLRPPAGIEVLQQTTNVQSGASSASPDILASLRSQHSAAARMASPSALSVMSEEEVRSLHVHAVAVGTRRSTVFSYMLLDLMVAEGIASILLLRGLCHLQLLI